MSFIFCCERHLLVREYEAALRHHCQALILSGGMTETSRSLNGSEKHPDLTAALNELEAKKFALEMHCACHRCQRSLGAFISGVPACSSD